MSHKSAGSWGLGGLLRFNEHERAKVGPCKCSARWLLRLPIWPVCHRGPTDGARRSVLRLVAGTRKNERQNYSTGDSSLLPHKLPTYEKLSIHWRRDGWARTPIQYPGSATYCSWTTHPIVKVHLVLCWPTYMNTIPLQALRDLFKFLTDVENLSG